MTEKPSAWRENLSIILEQMETTFKKILGRKKGKCHLYTALLHPHLFCFSTFALSFIQPFSYLMYILNIYCLAGTDICIFLVTAGLSTLFQISLEIPREPFPKASKSHHLSSSRSFPSPAKTRNS